MFYQKKTERWINDKFPLGAKVTHEDISPAPPATPTVVALPPQANTVIDGSQFKTFTEDEITEIKSNLNMIMDSQTNAHFN
jgi:hypothetical protein